jgi:N utilization substance protein B
MARQTPPPAAATPARRKGPARPAARPRTAARVAAVQALFQGEQTQTPAERVIDEFVRHRLGAAPGAGFEDGRAPDANVPLFARIVRTATTRQDDLDAMLAATLAEDWPIERLDPVLRALLRCAAAELLMQDGPPARVVINEYIDIAHGFFDGEEPGMANGVLDRLARRLRTGEFPQAN